MTYKNGIWIPEEHLCSRNRNKVEIQTYMQGVRVAWFIYEASEFDDDEPENIIYEINYCPFCGKKLEYKK